MARHKCDVTTYLTHMFTLHIHTCSPYTWHTCSPYIYTCSPYIQVWCDYILDTHVHPTYSHMFTLHLTHMFTLHIHMFTLHTSVMRLHTWHTCHHVTCRVISDMSDDMCVTWWTVCEIHHTRWLVTWRNVCEICRVKFGDMMKCMWNM